MTDGSPFVGYLSFGPPNFAPNWLGVSGMNLVTTRNLTPTDDTARVAVTVEATMAGFTTPSLVTNWP
jgi:hypothetical protein